MPLPWRVFLASSITISVLFAGAGWGLQQYALSAADASVRAEVRASIQVYQALWKSRTQVLSATTALMSAMSDVRAAFMTRDPKTIRDSAEELWSRVSDQFAVFLVLDPEGHLISSLGTSSHDLPVSAIPLKAVLPRFPRQLAGYLSEGSNLFYIVLTPVYVQSTGEPLLLNVLCAGFRIDDRVVEELKALAPGSEFAFLSGHGVFASTLDSNTMREVSSQLAGTGEPYAVQKDKFIVFRQDLPDVTGKPIARLSVLRSYGAVAASISKLRRSLGLAWLLTIMTALLVSLYMTRRLLEPVKILDRAASQIAARNYNYRVPVVGTDELSRLSATFNNMCDSIQETQAELVRQEQILTIGRLATSLVHDLRNPLAAIYGGAEMLVDGHLPPDQTQRIASNIYRASQRLQGMLRDLLNVSLGDTGNVEACNLQDIIASAAEPITGTANGVNVRISVDERAEVFTNRSRLERVFANLLSNAADAMPDGGDILIYTADEDGALTVCVEDTGPGIPKEIRSRIFRPFVSAKRSGLGLGLTLSRQAMLDLGGDLEIVEKPGPGACFRLRFGKAPEPATKQTENPEHVRAV
ncbi:MAG: HAMP domain-containing protein [Acidobacteriaceae bacterium]|nr:HAMP domain-containing protein [Acidobacteriaceae bacterium]MBV9501390.1 HAMP domain-containing protein [Acidobacteriaceae bacterium]